MDTIDITNILYNNGDDNYKSIFNKMINFNFDINNYDLNDHNILTLIGYYYYHKFKDYNTSLIYHNKSILLPNSVSYIHIGKIYEILKLTDRAKHYYELSIEKNKIGYYNMYILNYNIDPNQAHKYIDDGVENNCINSIITKIYNDLYLDNYDASVSLFEKHKDLIESKYNTKYISYSNFIIEYMKITKSDKNYINEIIIKLAEHSIISLHASYKNKHLSQHVLLKLYEIGINKLDKITIEKVFDYKLSNPTDTLLDDLIIRLIKKIDENNLIEYYRHIGNLYLVIKNNDKALSYLLKYDKYEEYIYVKAAIIFIYESQNNFETAIEYLNDTLNVIIEKDKLLDIIKLYINNDIKTFKLITLYLKKYDNINVKNMQQHLLNIKSIRYFHNKIKVFTELNNYRECNICLEKELNIILNCGHQVCINCYPKLNDKCFYKCEL